MEVERRGGVTEFEILEHPADIGFRAYGRTLPELFENAALAMLSIRAEVEDVQPKLQTPFQAEGTDIEVLLVNFLSQILSFVDGTAMDLRAVKVTGLSEMAVSYVAAGSMGDPNMHRVKLIVKGVTYHQLKISKTSAGFEATVYLDI